jgi:hypothetical protein
VIPVVVGSSPISHPIIVVCWYLPRLAGCEQYKVSFAEVAKLVDAPDLGSGALGVRVRVSPSAPSLIDRIDWVRVFVPLSKIKRPVTDGPFCIRLPARGQLIGEDDSVGSRLTRYHSRCHHGNLSLHPLRCGLPVLVADGHAAFVILFSFLFSLFSFLFSLFSFLFSLFSFLFSGFWILDSGFWILDSGFWILHDLSK